MATELKNFRRGKKPPRLDKRTLKFSNYRTTALPPPPASITYYQAVGLIPGWGMDGNDTYGDCTIAAAAHMILNWTANSNPPARQPSIAEILAAYNVVDGGVDQGADMLTVLNYWRQTGIGNDKVSAFVQLTTGNVDELKQAIDLFGAAYIGLELPDYVANDPTFAQWTLPPQDSSYPPGNPNDGHCVPVVGYDSTWLYVVTWGGVVQMDPGFFEAYNDEAYTVLSPDWFKPGGESPPGFDVAQLQADLTAITQSPPSPNPPSPTPSIWVRFLRWIEAVLHFG